MIDWPNALAGAVLGLLFAVAVPVGRSVVDYLRNSRIRMLSGAWYFYHPSLRAAGRYLSIEAEAKYDFWRREMSLSGTRSGIQSKVYRGTVAVGRGAILIELRYRRWADPIRIVLPDDAQAIYEPALGLMVGVDRRFVPVACEVVASRRPLSHQELEALTFFEGKIMYGVRP